MNWRRGLLRMWIVATILWLLGSTWWLLGEGYEQQKLMANLKCDIRTLNLAEYGECFRRQVGPSEGDTWFLAGLRAGNWLLLVAPPVIVLFLGMIFFKVGKWVMRGFSDSR